MIDGTKSAGLLVIDKYLDDEKKLPISEYPVLYKRASEWARDAIRAVGVETIFTSGDDLSALDDYETVIAVKANTIIRRSNMRTACNEHEFNTTIVANGDIVGQIYCRDEYRANRSNLFAGSDFMLNFDDSYIINNSNDLLRVNNLMRTAIINRNMNAGVIFTDLSGVTIGRDAKIAPGATVLPGTSIIGGSVIGQGSVIGPGSFLKDTNVGENSKLVHVVADSAVIGSECRVGPFTQLRPGSVIADKAKIGDFVEIKNSTIGEGTSVAHLTYVGDADIGKYCNFGCGVVVVNYDGEKKCHTTVGDYAFIGCNTNLISPVSVGDGAFTAAGSTITKDVPAEALAIERAEQRNIEGYSTRKLRNYFIKHNRKAVDEK